MRLKKFEFNKITLRDLWGLCSCGTVLNLRSIPCEDGRQYNYGQFKRGYNDPFQYFDFEVCKIDLISPFSITVQIPILEFDIITGKPSII